MRFFKLERVSEPDIEPVTLAEIKLHLRAYDSITTDDAQITALIVGAREWVEDFTGRALVDQSWRLHLSDEADSWDPVQEPLPVEFPPGILRRRVKEIFLHKSPVLAVTSFVSVNAAGEETEIAVADYELREADTKWPRIVGLNGKRFTTGTYRISFRAGYADRTGSPVEGTEVIPERFKQAIKLWVEANYDRDPAMMEKLLDVAGKLIRPERVDLQFA